MSIMVASKLGSPSDSHKELGLTKKNLGFTSRKSNLAGVGVGSESEILSF